MVVRTSLAILGLSIASLSGLCRCGAEPRGTLARRSALRGVPVAVGVRPRPGGAPALPGSLRGVPAQAALRWAPDAGAQRSAFALDDAGDVAAFDPDSGAVVARYAYGGLVTDACWDKWRRRVVFAQVDGWVDGSRVYALDWDGASFTMRAASDGVPAQARLLCTEEGALAIGDDSGVASWTLLDATLVTVGQSAPLPVVASLLPSASHWAVGLAPRVWQAGAYHDALVLADDPGGAWTTVTTLLAPGADATTRLVAGAGPDEAWLVRRPRQGGTLGVAAVDLADPASATFHGSAVVPDPGEIEDALFEPSQGALVLLVEGDAGATLDVVGTGPVASATHRHLPAHARKSNAVLHALALDPITGHVLVATEGGVLGFKPAGTRAEPALERVAAFDAPALRPPVIVP